MPACYHGYNALMRILISLAVLLVHTVACTEQYPDWQGQLARAGGSANGPQVLRAFADTSGFKPMPPPRAGDWRLGPGQSEQPQTLTAYRSSSPVRATKIRDRIVLQPLGPFKAAQQELLRTLRDFCAVYFGCEVELARPLPLPN
jgi:hypothetical protein